MKVSICNKIFWKNYMTILGYIGIPIGFISVFYNIEDNKKTLYAGIFLFVLVAIFLFNLYWANHLEKIEIEIKGNKIEISYGDLFNCSGLKVIPFNEYFDTIVNNNIIAPRSLNGQYINKQYNNKIEELNSLISNKLNNIDPIERVERLEGKKQKYKIGTTLEIENDYLVTAFSKFDNNNNAYLSKGEYLLFLEKFWNEVNNIYNYRNINIPLIGSGITRLGSDFKEQDYLEQILNSIKLSNLDMNHNSKICIVLHKDVKDKIDLYKIKYIFKGE